MSTDSMPFSELDIEEQRRFAQNCPVANCTRCRWLATFDAQQREIERLKFDWIATREEDE